MICFISSTSNCLGRNLVIIAISLFSIFIKSFLEAALNDSIESFLCLTRFWSKFNKDRNDTGAAEVQIGIFSERINIITSHLAQRF